MTIELDHIGLSVGDYARARAFYEAALKPLRMSVLMEYPASVTGDFDVMGLGADGKAFLWIGGGAKTSPHAHIAIRAESRAQVDGFYAAAVAAGGTDNGPPGLRPHYHEHYYGAFVLDPEGHNIEAVVHTPPVAPKAARKSPTRKAAAKPARKVARKPAKRAAAKPAKRASARKPVAKKKPARRGKKAR